MSNALIAVTSFDLGLLTGLLVALVPRRRRTKVSGQPRSDLPQSPYPGVSWCQRSDKWLVRATVEGKRRSIGRFEDHDTAVDVVRAIRRAELERKIGRAVSRG